MASTTQEERRAGLPIGFFTGPAIWGLQLLVGYALTPVACQAGSKWNLYLLSLIAGLLILIAGMIAVRNWRGYAQNHHLDLLDIETNVSRQEFVAMSGVFLSMIFFFLVLLTGVGMVFLSPCPVITMPMP